MVKKFYNQNKPKKVLKPVKSHSDKNCMVNVPLQFNVKRDLNLAKKIKPNTVFENYKENVKKTKK